MNNSFYDLLSTNCESFRAYELDFKKQGDFTTEESDGEINLCKYLFPGIFNGKKWIEAKSTDEETYLIYLEYKSRGRVDVIIDSQNPKLPKEVTEETYKLIQAAAEKFFLVNNLIPEMAINCPDKDIWKIWQSSIRSPKWSDVMALIEYYEMANEECEEKVDTRSWRKSMSMAEAKDLLSFLKIKVNFPK